MSYTKFIEQKVTAREARDVLLSRAPEVMNRLIDISLGIELSEDKMENYQNEPHIDALMELTKKMLPIIKIEDDRDAMQFNCNMETPEKELTARELLQMRIDGQLSPLELEQGMKFLQDKFEMEELSEVMEAIREHQDNG